MKKSIKSTKIKMQKKAKKKEKSKILSKKQENGKSKIPFKIKKQKIKERKTCLQVFFTSRDVTRRLQKVIFSNRKCNKKSCST